VNPRIFTTKIEQTHKRWLALILNMTPSKGAGIDLLDENLGIELKCRLDAWYQNWAVHDYQVNYFPDMYPERDLYWAFIVYGLRKDPRGIRGDCKVLEKYVTERTVRFLPWEFIHRFKIANPATGPYRYVTKPHLPKDEEFSKVWINSDCLLVPKNSSLENRMLDRGFVIGERREIMITYDRNSKIVTYE